MRVLLTQPAPRVEGVARRLTARGHEPLALPANRVDSLLERLPRDVVAGHVRQASCVIFVSPSAIDVLLETLAGTGWPWPSATEVAVMGPGSSEALAERGIDTSVTTVHHPVGPPFDSAALLALERFHHPGPAPADGPLLIVNGEDGRSDWIDVLRERGFDVDVLTAYRTQGIDPDPQALGVLARWVAERAPLLAVFTSSDAAARLTPAVAALDPDGWLRDRPALTIHPRIAATLRGLGWRDVRVIEPGERLLAAAIESVA